MPENITPQFNTPPASSEISLPTPVSASSTAQPIGGFMASPQGLTSGQLQLNAVGEVVLVGSAVSADVGSGVFMGNAGDNTYDFRAGDPSGSYIWWDGSAGSLTIVGTVTATAGTIGGFSIGADYLRDAANSFGLASTVTAGDDVRFWAGATFASRATAPFRVLESGSVTASNFALTGGSVATTAVDRGLQGWTSNLVFTSASAVQINWGSGTIKMQDGTSYSISSGNTGTMAAVTYIYLDINVSTTALQTTTTYSTAVGDGKVLIATAQNNTTAASVVPFGGGQPVLDGGTNIAALSITAGSIAASTITAAKMSVSTLSAIAADLGSITAGTIVLSSAGYMRSGQTDFDTGTGFFIGISGGTAKFSIGDSSGDKITWDGSALSITGVSNNKKNYTAGEAITAGNAVAAGLYQSDGGIQLDSKQSASATGTSLGSGVSFTVGSNSNRAIVVFLTTGSKNVRADNAVIGVTFNGTSLTKLDGADAQSDSGNASSFSSWILIAPATGAHTLVIGGLTAADTYAYSVHSYYNVKQTGQPLAHSGSSQQRGNTGTGSDISISVTSTSDGCLTIASGGNQTLFNTSGAGGDTGIMIPKGLYSLTTTNPNGVANSAALVCIEPATAPTAAVVIASAKARNVTDYWATTNYKSTAFIGFADAGIVAGIAGAIIIAGDVPGLSSLSLGTQYYLSDTYGAVSSTAGTNTRKVAIGTSTTSLLITNIW